MRPLTQTISTSLEAHGRADLSFFLLFLHWALSSSSGQVLFCTLFSWQAPHCTSPSQEIISVRRMRALCLCSLPQHRAHHLNNIFAHIRIRDAYQTRRAYVHSAHGTTGWATSLHTGHTCTAPATTHTSFLCVCTHCTPLRKRCTTPLHAAPGYTPLSHRTHTLLFCTALHLFHATTACLWVPGAGLCTAPLYLSCWEPGAVGAGFLRNICAAPLCAPPERAHMRAARASRARALIANGGAAIKM